jgi:hypothetical protein
LVVSSLKAIGNIGSFSNKNVLENCAKEKSNSLEVRVSAIEAFRRFPCEEKQDLNGNYDILKDSDDDSEVRIKAFRSIVQCLNGQKFQNFAANEFAGFLANENDLQVSVETHFPRDPKIIFKNFINIKKKRKVVSYIIDFGKEHGVTSLINPALANPLVKEKLQTNFKEYSWNNYKYTYSVKHDGALEIDSSFVYTPKSFIPRSINFNLTGHLLGVSINSIDATLRLEGLDEILKAALVDKLTSEDLVKRLMEKPEQLLPILQALADKVCIHICNVQGILCISVFCHQSSLSIRAKSHTSRWQYVFMARKCSFRNWIRHKNSNSWPVTYEPFGHHCTTKRNIFEITFLWTES